jgi:membrane protein required for colicin V production
MNDALAAIDEFRLLGLTALDLFVVVVVLLSTLLALFRGMSREALMLLAWLGAAAAAWLGWPQVAPLLEPYIADPTIRTVAAIAIAFIVPLIVLLILAGMIASIIENSFLAPVDRLLGVVFGALRGAVLVLVTYFVLLFVFPPPDTPSWIREAVTRPWLDRGLRYAQSWAPQVPLPGDETVPTSEGSARAEEAPASEGDSP